MDLGQPRLTPWHHREKYLMNWNDCPGILRNPEICGGEYIFTGSRVPVRALFENLRDGASVQEFSQWFPSVSLEAAGQVLKFLEASLSKKGSLRPL